MNVRQAPGGWSSRTGFFISGSPSGLRAYFEPFAGLLGAVGGACGAAGGGAMCPSFTLFAMSAVCASLFGFFEMPRCSFDEC